MMHVCITMYLLDASASDDRDSAVGYQIPATSQCGDLSVQARLQFFSFVALQIVSTFAFYVLPPGHWRIKDVIEIGKELSYLLKPKPALALRITLRPYSRQ